MKKSKLESLKKQNSEYLSDKKSWVLFIFQIIFMLASLMLVLWGQQKLRSVSKKTTPSLERKADFIPFSPEE